METESEKIRRLKESIEALKEKIKNLTEELKSYKDEGEGEGASKGSLIQEKGWITLTVGEKSISIRDCNEGGEYGLFTYDEATELFSDLEDRHLPTKEEWQELVDLRCEYKGYETTDGCVFDADSYDGTVGEEFAKDFRLPFAGYRRNSTANVDDQGSYGYYWSSSRYNANYAFRLAFHSSGISPQYYNRRAYGFSVRCFQNK